MDTVNIQVSLKLANIRKMITGCTNIEQLSLASNILPFKNPSIVQKKLDLILNLPISNRVLAEIKVITQNVHQDLNHWNNAIQDEAGGESKPNTIINEFERAFGTINSRSKIVEIPHEESKKISLKVKIPLIRKEKKRKSSESNSKTNSLTSGKSEKKKYKTKNTTIDSLNCPYCFESITDIRSDHDEHLISCFKKYKNIQMI